VPEFLEFEGGLEVNATEAVDLEVEQFREDRVSHVPWEGARVRRGGEPLGREGITAFLFRRRSILASG
jgi:hypothetical protein